MSSSAPITALLCAECEQPIAWFDAGTNGPFSGWIHTDLNGGEADHRAQPPAPASISLRPKPAIFWLDRDVDATGTSGVGRVAEGVVFSNGWCALTWLTEFTNVAFYPDIVAVQAIHGHDGKTRITFKEQS